MSFLTLTAASAGVTITAQIVTVVIAFVIVLGILYKFAWGPIIQLIDDRAKAITSGFDEITTKTIEAENLRKEYEERLRRIDDEARERMNKAIDEGRKQAADIIESARKESEDIIQKTKASLDLEVDKARLELRREAVEMALSATGKLLDANLDNEQQRKLVTQFVDQVGGSTGS